MIELIFCFSDKMAREKVSQNSLLPQLTLVSLPGMVFTILIHQTGVGVGGGGDCEVSMPVKTFS